MEESYSYLVIEVGTIKIWNPFLKCKGVIYTKMVCDQEERFVCEILEGQENIICE